MKTYLLFLILCCLGFSAQAQLTEEYSKNRNATFNRPSDTLIVFPITGKVTITTKYYATKPTTEVEYYIYDALGREVYYEIFISYGGSLPAEGSDAGYAYYMSMQGNYVATRKPETFLVTR